MIYSQMGTDVQVWENYKEQEASVANGDAQEGPTSSGETVSVTVTELADANTFYVQVSNNNKL